MDNENSMNQWGRGLQQVSDVLIRRGTAMGPMVPLLFLVPCFMAGAFFFQDTPLVMGAFVLGALGIVGLYAFHYAKFAKNDPDRLQSEEYRHGMRMIDLIAGKELPHPMSTGELRLRAATANPAHPLPDLQEIAIDSDAERKS